MRYLIIFIYVLAVLIAGAYIVASGISIMNVQQQQYDKIIEEIHR